MHRSCRTWTHPERGGLVLLQQHLLRRDKDVPELDRCPKKRRTKVAGQSVVHLAHDHMGPVGLDGLASPPAPAHDRPISGDGRSGETARRTTLLANATAGSTTTSSATWEPGPVAPGGEMPERPGELSASADSRSCSAMWVWRRRSSRSRASCSNGWPSRTRARVHSPRASCARSRWADRAWSRFSMRRSRPCTTPAASLWRQSSSPKRSSMRVPSIARWISGWMRLVAFIRRVSPASWPTHSSGPSHSGAVARSCHSPRSFSCLPASPRRA